MATATVRSLRARARACAAATGMGLGLLTASAAPLAAQSRATPDAPQVTTVMVRAVSHDAKVIGSNVGGARITVRDAGTGEVLARGVQEGTTGSTRLLVVEPRSREPGIFAADGAAGFAAELALDVPTVVEITAEGPLGTRHALQRASKTLLVVPGVDLVGDGLVIELNGFTVGIDAPVAERAFDAGEPIEVTGVVTMICGCPLEPGGLWDADRVRVLARLVRGGEVVAEEELAYAGRPNHFAGTLRAPAAGEWQLQVLALDPERANTGMAAVPVRVR